MMPEHRRETDPDTSRHSRASDSLLEALLNMLVETNGSLGKLSNWVEEVDNKLSRLDQKVSTHMADESIDIITIKKDIQSLSSEALSSVKELKSKIDEITPFAKQAKEKAIVWDWATKVAPNIVNTIYKGIVFVAAVVISSWAFIEFLLSKKLGQ